MKWWNGAKILAWLAVFGIGQIQSVVDNSPKVCYIELVKETETKKLESTYSKITVNWNSDHKHLWTYFPEDFAAAIQPAKLLNREDSLRIVTNINNYLLSIYVVAFPFTAEDAARNMVDYAKIQCAFKLGIIEQSSKRMGKGTFPTGTDTGTWQIQYRMGFFDSKSVRFYEFQDPGKNAEIINEMILTVHITEQLKKPKFLSVKGFLKKDVKVKVIGWTMFQQCYLAFSLDKAKMLKKLSAKYI